MTIEGPPLGAKLAAYKFVAHMYVGPVIFRDRCKKDGNCGSENLKQIIQKSPNL